MRRDNTEIADDKKNIKKATIMAIIACILIMIAFSCLIGAVFLQEYDYFDTVVLPLVLGGFFGGNIIALVLLCKAYPTLVISDCMKMNDRYERQEPMQIRLPERESLGRKFLDSKFQYTEDGYYMIKSFSFLKDSVCYYARITEDIEVENALRREVERLYQLGKNEKNLCMLLFVYMDAVREREKQDIKELGKRNIVLESVINPNLSLSVLIIAVDRGTNTGYYMKIGRHGRLTLYSYGCKMLKKLFGEGSEKLGSR